MPPTTLGKYRGLQALSTPRGAVKAASAFRAKARGRVSRWRKPEIRRVSGKAPPETGLTPYA